MAFKSLLPGISLRAYARRRGCSAEAVRKAIKARRLIESVRMFDTPRVIDPDLADHEWRANKRKAGRPSTKRFPTQRMCRTCGGAVGRKRLYCAECIAVRRRQQAIAINKRIKAARAHSRICATCPSTISKARRFCDACRLNRRNQQNKNKRLIPQTCTRCGREFLAKVDNTQERRYCSSRCQKPVRALVPCPRCGKEFWPWKSGDHKRMYCSRACSIPPRTTKLKRVIPREQRQCAWCAEPFIVSVNKARKYCCKPHQLLAKSKRRKAILRNVGGELPSLWAIYERDNGRCALCRRHVDRSLRWPHRMCASIDHVIPLSKGGRDEATNVQLAHLTCNQRKQARIDRLF